MTTASPSTATFWACPSGTCPAFGREQIAVNCGLCRAATIEWPGTDEPWPTIAIGTVPAWAVTENARLPNDGGYLFDRPSTTHVDGRPIRLMQLVNLEISRGVVVCGVEEPTIHLDLELDDGTIKLSQVRNLIAALTELSYAAGA